MNKRAAGEQNNSGARKVEPNVENKTERKTDDNG
jgi:hypothetical protein